MAKGIKEAKRTKKQLVAEVEGLCRILTYYLQGLYKLYEMLYPGLGNAPDPDEGETYLSTVSQAVEELLDANKAMEVEIEQVRSINKALEGDALEKHKAANKFHADIVASQRKLLVEILLACLPKGQTMAEFMAPSEMDVILDHIGDLKAERDGYKAMVEAFEKAQESLERKEG